MVSSLFRYSTLVLFFNLSTVTGFKDIGDQVEIPEIKATAFSLLLDYLYTGDVVLPMGDLTLHFELLK